MNNVVLVTGHADAAEVVAESVELAERPLKWGYPPLARIVPRPRGYLDDQLTMNSASAAKTWKTSPAARVVVCSELAEAGHRDLVPLAA